MKIAVIVHVFHCRHWKELVACIKNFSFLHPDVFITISTTLSDDNFEEIQSDFPTAKIKRVENRGFDVGPFIKTISEINVDNYDFIAKLHTKRNRFGIVNYMPMFGGQWRRKLLSFCRDRSRIEKALEIFSSRPDVGMIGAGELIVKESGRFIGGTMFIARASIFVHLDKQVKFSDFEMTERHQMNSLAHSWERKLGYLVEANMMKIHGYPAVSSLFVFTYPLRRFLYEFLAFWARRLRN